MHKKFHPSAVTVPPQCRLLASGVPLLTTWPTNCHLDDVTHTRMHARTHTHTHTEAQVAVYEEMVMVGDVQILPNNLQNTLDRPCPHAPKHQGTQIPGVTLQGERETLQRQTSITQCTTQPGVRMYIYRGLGDAVKSSFPSRNSSSMPKHTVSAFAHLKWLCEMPLPPPPPPPPKMFSIQH